MNKPHVDKLHYRMIIPETVNFDAAPPVTAETDSFSMTVSKDGVIFTMKEQFKTEQDAREITDRYLDGWAVIIGLGLGPGVIEFRFDRSEIIDREPPTDGKIYLTGSASAIAKVFGSLTVYTSHPKYPDPPDGFTISPDVQTMYDRYRAYREGRDRLLSMAYLVLTILEKQRGRQRAAHKYRISKKVLDRLGTLCSQGDPQDARKAPKNGSFSPLNGQDKAWIETAIKLIIKRVGLIEGGTMDLPQITMADLPPTGP